MRIDEAMIPMRRLVEETEPERIALILLDVIASVGLAPSVGFYRLDALGASLRLEAHRGLLEPVVPRLQHLPIDDETLAGRVAKAGRFQSVDVQAGESVGWDVRAMGTVGFGWAVPLLSGENTLGVVQGLRAEPLSVEDREVLEGLVGIAASSIARCMAEPTRRLVSASFAIAEALRILPADHMRAAVQRGFQLWPTSFDANIAESLRKVLSVIVREARAVVGAEMAALGIGDNPERPFDPWVFDGVPPDMEERMGRHPRPVGTLGVVTRGVPVRVRDVKRHPAFVGLPPGHPDITSLLGVPIEYGRQTLGNLYLANKVGGDEFTAEDEATLEALVTYAGLALQQTYLRSAVQGHEAQLHSIFESAPHGILFVDALTEHVMANPPAMQLFGGALDPKRGCAQYLHLLRGADGGPVFKQDLPSIRALRGERTTGLELLIMRPGGTPVPVVESAAPVFGFDDRLLGAVVNLEDISSFKQLERLHEEFAAMIVHDLRGPINSIVLRAARMRSLYTQPIALVQDLSRIEDSGRQLACMVTELLDTTRIDLHQLSISPVPVSLVRTVEQAIEQIALRLGAARDIRLSTPTEPLPDVALDVSRFEQVLANLLDNAAKHSPCDAPIDVRIEMAEDGGLLTSVEDHGTGMAPADLEHAFDRFYQSEPHEPGNGLGLGLYICKGLVEAHGGHIRGESTLGEGTTIHIWLPAHEASRTDPV